MDSSETFCICVQVRGQQLAEARRAPGPSEGRRTPPPLLHHVTTFNPNSLPHFSPSLSVFSFVPDSLEIVFPTWLLLRMDGYLVNLSPPL